jgi:hypothetical protein
MFQQSSLLVIFGYRPVSKTVPHPARHSSPSPPHRVVPNSPVNLSCIGGCVG